MKTIVFIDLIGINNSHNKNKFSCILEHAFLYFEHLFKFKIVLIEIQTILENLKKKKVFFSIFLEKDIFLNKLA